MKIPEIKDFPGIRGIPMMQLVLRLHPPGCALTGFEDVDQWACTNDVVWHQITDECRHEKLPDEIRIKMIAVALLRMHHNQLGDIRRIAKENS